MIYYFLKVLSFIRDGINSGTKLLNPTLQSKKTTIYKESERISSNEFLKNYNIHDMPTNPVVPL